MNPPPITTQRVEDLKAGSWFPRVTIVIPAYNVEGTIGPCLESLLAQAYPSEHYEIIVVDNNSSDGTCARVQEYPVRLAFERDVQSPGAARNRGIELAKSEIVVFIDSDCIAEADWLGKLVQPFRDPGIGVVGCTVLSQEPDSSLVEAFLAETRAITEQHYPSTEPGGFPSTAVAYRRAALDQVGMFDASMQASEDVDLAWRVQVYGGYEGAFASDAVVYNKHRSTSRGMFHQFRRYGFSDIVLTTLYRNETFHQRTPGAQLRKMGQQALALGRYGMSFMVRLTRRGRWKLDRHYLAWPALRFVLESGNLVGKLQGVFATRGFRHVPFPAQAGIKRGSAH
jgi:cellulose synthase/poly-beta-1,6-N-acetylglucosamine synthase-like glycosyltransferase